jgi:hypothetical protein
MDMERIILLLYRHPELYDLILLTLESGQQPQQAEDQQTEAEK